MAKRPTLVSRCISSILASFLSEIHAIHIKQPAPRGPVVLLFREVSIHSHTSTWHTTSCRSRILFWDISHGCFSSEKHCCCRSCVFNAASRDFHRVDDALVVHVDDRCFHTFA